MEIRHGDRLGVILRLLAEVRTGRSVLALDQLDAIAAWTDGQIDRLDDGPDVRGPMNDDPDTGP